MCFATAEVVPACLPANIPKSNRCCIEALRSTSTILHGMQAMWVQFAPPAAVADAASWQMYKLGRPISPLEVVHNGSQSMHAVSDEGISVSGAGQGGWEQLNIRSS